MVLVANGRNRFLTILLHKQQIGKRCRTFMGPNTYICPGECWNEPWNCVFFLVATNILGATNIQEVAELVCTMTVMAP